MSPAASAWGWIDTGHKLVALIAWDQLTPATRLKVVALLKQHPRYQQDLLRDQPSGEDDADTARYAFAMASTWPDIVRSPGNPMHNLYNHPAWHYIDLPYVLGGQSVPAVQAAMRSGPHDVVEAINKSIDDLKQTQVNDHEKAVALCWILHLCGDIHQPLHACDMYSPQFPNGDQGGNAFIVLRDPPYTSSLMNLHLIWDQMVGQYKSMDAIVYLAAGMEHDPRLWRERFSAKLKITDPAAWAQESHALAVRYAYLDGALKGTTKDVPHDFDHPAPGLPPGYLARAEQVAFAQVALAGYRTADLLNSIFDAR